MLNTYLPLTVIHVVFVINVKWFAVYEVPRFD